MAAVPKKKSRSCEAPAAASCKPSKVPGEDSVCFLCHDGGTLVMCDRRQCPKAYHPACVGRSMQFFKTKGAWLCARHFCSKCSKQPRTYCVMCPNSFCSKCLSCMPTGVYLPLSEDEGLCRTCMSLAKMIELQEDTIEGKTAVNFDDSETVEFLFKEYWLLLKRFHGYNLTNSALSCTESLSPSGSSDKHVKGDVPSLGVDQKIRSDPQKPSCNIVTATMPNTCIGLLKPSPTNESISVSKNSRFLIKRRSTSGSILPAKKKIRVLKLLNDSSSEDDNENKPLSSMLCEIKNSICSKALPITKSVSSEIILDSSVDGAYLGVKPFSVNSISSSPKPLLNVIEDSGEPLPVASSVTSPPPSPLIKPMIHPSPAADTSPANYSKLFKKPHSNKDLTTSPSENDRAQSLNPPACADDLVSAKELSELAFRKPRPTPGSTSKPPPMEKLSPLTAAPKPLRIKPLSLAVPAPDKQMQQLPQDTNKDMPSSNGASPDCKRPSKSLLPLKRSHGRSHAQESCRTVDATSSTCDKAEALAPINVQNVSRIYLRRSHLEELLSDQRFTLLILGAFVRIRHSKQENNYRLVQIAGTSTLQAHYYQIGEKKTNVVLEVLNLNKRQRIKIDHVSNNMFTGEECERLQQSVELGFINAPTVRALEEKAAALQKVKANKCLDGQFAELASKIQSKETGFNKECKEEGGKNPLSPDHLVKFFTPTQIYEGEEVQADQAPACVESTTTKSERGSEYFEAKIETALADSNGVGRQIASVLYWEKRRNECPNYSIDEYLKREIQDKAEDRHIVLNDAQIAAGKQADADQHSDISVEMTTVFAETGQSNMHSPEILTTLKSQNCTEDEAELTLPKKSQKKGLRDFGSNKYLMKEHCASLMAETMNQAQGDGPVEVFLRKHMDVGPHYDVCAATNINEIAEDRMHGAKLSRTSAGCPCTKDVVTSNLPQRIPLTESQEYRIIQHPTDKPHTGVPFQIENQGCAQEYATTVVGLNDFDKRAVDLMQWFYQDMEERTFGPFSLEQLRKWSKTGVFPPDLKIWRIVAGQKSSILLVDALNVKEIKVLGIATEKCIAVESCLDPLKQKGIIFTESGSTCHITSNGFFGDRGMPTSRTDWQSTSAHAGQSLDSCINLGDWTVPIEQVELKSRTLWSSPHSTHFSIEDVSAKRSQGKTSSCYFEHPVLNKECEKALKIQTQMNTDLHTSATETSAEGEIQHKSNPKDAEGKSKPAHTTANEEHKSNPKDTEGKSKRAHTKAKETCAEGEIQHKSNLKDTEGKSKPANTKAKETSAEGERGVQSTPAHTSGKEISAVEQIGGKFSPVCTEGKSSPVHPVKETRATSDIGLNSQSLAEETSSDRKRKRECTSVSQRQDTLTIDEGWTSPETWDFELETWATQYDALRKEEASINRCRDEILSNLIDAVSTKGTTAENDCYTFTKDTSACGNNISCNTEQRLEELTTLDDGWGSPGELDQGTGWGSPNSTWFNKSEQKISLVQSCHDKRPSKKLQLTDERENTQAGGVHDGAQKNVDCNLSERGEGRSLSHDMHPEKDQRWTHSSQGHGRAQRVEDTDYNISSRGRDMSLFENSGCQRSFCHLESAWGQARKFEDHSGHGKGTDRGLNRSYSRESIMCGKQDKFRSGQRCFSSERNTSLKPSGREVEKAFMRSHSREPHKKDRCRRDQRSLSSERNTSPKPTGREVESACMRSHSREPHKQDWCGRDQRALSEEQKDFAENRHETEEEVRISYLRKAVSRASPENAGKRMGREIRKSQARHMNDIRSISREQKASPESAGQRTDKEAKRSHSRKDWRSLSRDQRSSPEYGGNREAKRFHSRNNRRSISRERKVYSEITGEREVRRSHSGNDWRPALRERKASLEGAEMKVRKPSHSRNDDLKSFSRELEASPENAGKITDKEVRSSQARNNLRALSKEPKSSSRNAGRREEEEDWKTHSRDDLKSSPRERRASPIDHNRSSYRSFSGNLVGGVHRGASREGRWERNNYTGEKFSGREKGSSPWEEFIEWSGHVFCPKESTLQPTQTRDQGWTPPDSPLNYPTRCWSLGVATVEKLDDPLVLSGLNKSEAPLHPGAPELVLSDSYPELPPPPPMPISAAPNHMKPPPPPPLPAETSHIRHIDEYTMRTIVK